MGKQLVLGSVLGAIVLFVWSAIAWMLIPWPGEPLRAFTNEDAVAQAIKANAPRSGNYLLPNEPKRTAGMTNEQYQKMEQEASDRMGARVLCDGGGGAWEDNDGLKGMNPSPFGRGLGEGLARASPLPFFRLYAARPHPGPLPKGEGKRIQYRGMCMPKTATQTKS